MTRLLLARPDHLGDIVLALPAARLLVETIPEAQVDVLASASLAGVVRRCPWVGDVIGAPFPAPTSSDDPAGWADAVDALAPTLAGRYKAALIPRIDDPWSSRLTEAAGIPIRVGYDHPRTAQYLSHRAPVPEHRHVTRLAGDLASLVADALGVSASHRTEPATDPWLVPNSADLAEARNHLAALGVDPTAGYVVIQPGAGWVLKRWRTERWGAVARHIAEQHGLQAVVSGDRNEASLVEAVVAASSGAAVGLAGVLSLGGLLGLLAEARLVVGVDSGPLQVAAAVGAPVVALFGPADPGEFAPWAPAERLMIVRSSLPCSPCRSLDAPPCGASELPACVETVSVAWITRAVDSLLVGT